MTDDEIIRLFQDAPDDGSDESAVRIGHSIRNATLEEAAELCDQLWTRAGDADECSDAIRALKTKEGE